MAAYFSVDVRKDHWEDDGSDGENGEQEPPDEAAAEKASSVDGVEGAEDVPSWTETLNAETYDAGDIAQLLDEQNQLTTSLAQLREAIKSGEDKEKLLCLVDAAEDHASSAQEVFRSCYEMLPTDSDGELLVKAQEVFDTPELLEHILQYLTPRELLIAQRISHATDAAIKTSHKVQRVMHIRPDNTAFFAVVELDPPPIYVHFRPFQIQTDQFCSVFEPEQDRNNTSITVTLDSHPLPEAGERLASMLICQPPLREMHVTTSCCEDWLRGRREPDSNSLKSDTGLTVGDLLRQAQSLRKAHELCIHENPLNLDEEGYARATITFTSPVIRLRDDDPIAVWRQEEQEEANKQREPSWERDIYQAKQLHYGAAKVAAWEDKRSVPTLAEWEQGSWEGERPQVAKHSWAWEDW